MTEKKAENPFKEKAIHYLKVAAVISIGLLGIAAIF